MKKEILNLNFNATLQKKIPHKTQLTNKLMDLLLIEKEAVYRRLRGEVPFSFAEAAVISQNLGISMDKLIGVQSEKRRYFSLQLTDFEAPGETDYLMWENYNHVLEIFGHHPPFTVCETWNTLPFPLCYRFRNLTRFYIYKWSVQANLHFPMKSFEELTLDSRFLVLGDESLELIQQATETHYILSRSMIRNLLTDISFFKSIRLVNEDSSHCLIQELEECINYLEEIATTGEFPETGSKVYLYVSGIGIETDYSLIAAEENYITLLRTLVLTAAATTDDLAYHAMTKWFTSLKRFSTHISVSGEKERIDFFKQLREDVNNVK